MNELQIFNHPDFGQVRTTDENGAILFCGKDVAVALGYKSPKDAISAHCKGAVKRRLPTASGMQEMSFIPESDLYRLIFSSKLPTAEKFTDWVTSEVLPSIRKTGAYRSGAALDAETLIRCSEIMAECRPENRLYVLNILKQVIPGIDCTPENPPAQKISRGTTTDAEKRLRSVTDLHVLSGKGFNRMKLIELIVENGYSLSGLARELACSKATCSRWINGKSLPCELYRYKLCDLFNITYGYFDL